MICPILNGDCRKADCAWFGFDGQCCIVTLTEIPERLEDVTNALQDVKRSIDGVITAL